MVPYGWTLGLVIGLVVVVAVVALVTPILVLAYKIGTQARELDAALSRARENTAGLAGLSTADVTLRGVLVSQGAYVAMLHGTDEKTYIVRTGDKLADGTIRTITSEMMLIQQQVNDPLSRQKEREVRKMLRHSDGTN